MSALGSTPAGNGRRPVPGRARALAARLAALFERDVELVGRLNDAQRRLTAANERLWSGLAPDAFGRIDDGAAPAGHSQIAQLIDTARGARAPGSETALLQALQDIHWQLHRSFHRYQQACEERRQLAVEVGELSLKLTDALCAAGFTGDDAQNADVHQLAAGILKTTAGTGVGR
jgi:hypothetical protein